MFFEHPLVAIFDNLAQEYPLRNLTYRVTELNVSRIWIAGQAA